MSRRRAQPRDFVNAVGSALLVEQLRSMLQTVSEAEAGVIRLRFGLDGGLPRTWDELAETYGVTRERIRQIEREAMDKLRDPARSTVLEGYQDGLVPDILRHYRGPDPGHLVHCDRHGWFERIPPIHDGPTCAQCPCSLFGGIGRIGRPAKYCSNACRQAAYRRRKTTLSFGQRLRRGFSC